MPVLVQICIVIATLALVVTTVTALLILSRLVQVAGQLTSALHVAIAQTEQLANETRELLSAVHEMAGPAREAWTRLGVLGARVEGLSTAIVDELEGPVLTSVALARGVRMGTKRFVELLLGRLMRSSSSKNGVDEHE